MQVRLRSNLDTGATGVEAFLESDTPGVRIRTGYAAFEEIPAGMSGSSLAPHFSFTVDEDACTTTIRFRLESRWDGGRSTSYFVVPVGERIYALALDDDFEQDRGWLTGGDALQGFWVREDPHEVLDAVSNPVQPEDDTTPDPGSLCWITANPLPGGGFDPTDGDVDRGTVWLESPPFDGTDADVLDFSFSRWFTLRYPAPYDDSYFRVLLSRDDGVNWTLLDQFTTDSAFWATLTYDLASIPDLTSTMRVRMEVTEYPGVGGDTLLEGLVDDARIERERLECDAVSFPSRQAPNGVGDTLLLDRSSTHLRLDWQAPPSDAGHDPATSYRVYRSEAPDAGFEWVSEPTSTFEVLMDDMLVHDTGYFSVTAVNSGGTSGDEPAP